MGVIDKTLSCLIREMGSISMLYVCEYELRTQRATIFSSASVLIKSMSRGVASINLNDKEKNNEY